MTETTTAAGGTGGGTDIFRFVTHVARGRWVSLFASMVIMAGAGGTYIFGIYSKEIKSSLGYDQSTLNLLGFFKDLGANIGVLSGLIAEVTPTWFLLLIGSAMNFSGFLMIWLAVTGKIARPKVWQMCMYICLGANSQNFTNTGVLVTCVTNFPENRGVLLGLLKGFAGLSGAIMTQIYLALYGHNPQSLILLVAWLPAAICIFFVYTIRVIKAVREQNEVKMLYNFLYVSIALALFLMAMTIAQNLVTFSRAAYASSGAIVACFMLLVPLAIAVKKELVLWTQKKESASPMKITIQEPPKLVHKGKSDPKEATCFGDICNKPLRGEDYTILQALLSIDMMVLFVSTMCGIGSSLTAVDNLGQIGESLGYPTRTIQTFVSLVSIWNYFGRIFAGLVSEKLIMKYKCPRPLMTTLVLFLSCVGHLLIAFPIPGSVYVASVIIGFSFGAQFPLLNAIVSELFGLKHYATLFNVGQLASPLGSYILNVKVAGLLYDREALKGLRREKLSRDSVKELTCIGPKCFRLAFVILAFVTLFGALASILLVMRTKEFYRGDIYKKFRVDEKEVDEVETNQGGESNRKNEE